jgi:hypothetical protein
MKKGFSLWRFLREELESERRGLVFAIMLLVPVAVALVFVCAHLSYLQPVLEKVDYLMQKQKEVVVALFHREGESADEGKIKQ